MDSLSPKSPEIQPWPSNVPEKTPTPGHENFQNLLNTATEALPVQDLDTTAFTYYDPEKKHKISDPTLKAIQKQALLSYYERQTGKSVSNSSFSPKPASDSKQLDYYEEFKKQQQLLDHHEAEQLLRNTEPVHSRSASSGSATLNTDATSSYNVIPLEKSNSASAIDTWSRGATSPTSLHHQISDAIKYQASSKFSYITQGNKNLRI